MDNKKGAFMSDNMEILKKRDLKEIANRVNNSGVANLLSYEEFYFITNYMDEKKIEKIILNTTLTSPTMPTMKYRIDKNTLIISPFFEDNSVDNANIIINKKDVTVSFINNKIVEYEDKMGVKRILINYIDQLKQINKVFKRIDEDKKKKEEEDKILNKYGMKLD